MQLEGKVAVVTGGGRGIGRGIVDRFREEGASVVVVQRGGLDDSLEADPQVRHVSADLSDVDALGAAVDRAAACFDGLDVLVNNAGMMLERAVSEISRAEWDLMVALNLRAPLFLTQAAIPHLRRRGGEASSTSAPSRGWGRIRRTRRTAPPRRECTV